MLSFLQINQQLEVNTPLHLLTLFLVSVLQLSYVVINQSYLLMITAKNIKPTMSYRSYAEAPSTITISSSVEYESYVTSIFGKNANFI